MRTNPGDPMPPCTGSDRRSWMNALAASHMAKRSAAGLALAMAVLAIAACGDEDPTDPSTDPLVVTTTTTGSDIDANGYLVTVDDSITGNRVVADSIAANGSTSFASLPAGTYLVELHGVAENCTVSSMNPQAVTLAATGTASVHFDVVCVAINDIVFGSDRDGDFDLYIMRADGSGLHQLTTDSLIARYPTWSRGGSQVAFVRSIAGGDGDIWIISADGTGLRQVTSDPFPAGVGVAWAGDGKRIAFVSDRAGPTRFDIYTIDTSGSGIRQVTTDSANDVFPRWSSDSTRILFHSDRTGNKDLFTIHPDGTGLVQLTSSPADDQFGDWSPDNSRIAFVSTRDGGDTDVFIMNADGTGVVQITANTWAEAVPNWRPDGLKFASVSQRGGDFNVYKMDPDGTNVEQLTTATGTVLVTDWNPDPRP